jgi:hypothetical protein
MSSDDPKPTNFGGGLSEDVLSSLTVLFSPKLNQHISAQTAANVLAALAQEEHAGANPGPGTAGFYDVMMKINELKAGVAAVNAASGKDIDTQAAHLVEKLDALTELWQIGPVAPGFFTVKVRNDNGNGDNGHK